MAYYASQLRVFTLIYMLILSYVLGHTYLISSSPISHSPFHLPWFLLEYKLV